MAKTKPKKKTTKKPATTITTTPKTPNKLTKKTTKKTKKPKPKTSSDSDSDPLTLIQSLLNPFPKDHLVTLVTDLALSHPTLSSLVESAADTDISHRKIFIHGLAWDATRHSIEPIFQSYGPIEDLNVVLDRSTGKCKGYAFLTFKTRKSAQKLLKNPRVMIGNRIASCQLASAGTPTSTPTPTPGGVGIGIVSQQHFPASSDYAQRKIYVNNVPVNADAGKLRALFEKFGEIESGPTGLDPDTGKFRGYALFVYRMVEGARRALEEPVKVFEGTQLACRKAAEGKGKFGGGAASITTALQPVQPQMLAAVAQAQNMALLGQGGFMNPLYAGGGMIGGGANLGAALMGGYYGMMGGQVQGLGLGGYGGVGTGGVGVGGAEGGFGGGGRGSSGAMLQGLQYLYPSGDSGQASPLPNKGSGASASGGYFSSL